MDGIVTRPAEEMSREELYELVWQTPMGSDAGGGRILR